MPELDPPLVTGGGGDDLLELHDRAREREVDRERLPGDDGDGALLLVVADAEDAELLEDLMALVALGLLEERPSPEGPVFALTELGRRLSP